MYSDSKHERELYHQCPNPRESENVPRVERPLSESLYQSFARNGSRTDRQIGYPVVIRTPFQKSASLHFMATQCLFNTANLVGLQDERQRQGRWEGGRERREVHGTKNNKYIASCIYIILCAVTPLFLASLRLVYEYVNENILMAYRLHISISI